MNLQPAAELSQFADYEAEYSVIGWIFTNNSVLEHLAFLHASHFYTPEHAAIFEEIVKLHKAGQVISPHSVKTALGGRTDVNLPGGYPVSNKVFNLSMAYSRPIELASYIVDLSKKREMEAMYTDALVSLSNSQPAVEHALNLSKKLEVIARDSIQTKIRDDYEVTASILEGLKDQRKPHSTGIPKLDKAMDGGLYPGKAYGIAARKKVGKTTLASTISHNLGLQGVNHLFICGEMSDEEIQQRNLSRATDTYPSAFRTDYGKSADFQMRIAEQARISKRAIKYINAPGLTFEELKRASLAGVFNKGAKGIILDYWQLVGGKPKGKSEAEHLDEVAQWIANFSRQQGIWSLTMAQINQTGNTRGGEGIRLAFDQVFELHRDDVTMPYAWLEMMETRYTAWMNIGDKDNPGLIMHDKGPWFEGV